MLLAIPPDVDGETMKMNVSGSEEGRGGGRWDPMKRVIVWTWDGLECGETKEVQLQFQYLGGVVKQQQRRQQQQSGNNGEVEPAEEEEHRAMPRFPILVRCDGKMDQLSSIGITVGSGAKNHGSGTTEGGESSSSPYRLDLTQSYRLFHRKVG